MIGNRQIGGLAPVALFAYRRVDHLRRVIDALQANPEAVQTDLVVFSDGPRRPEHAGDVEAVRSLVRTVNGFMSVRLVQRECNLGLSRSIISGVTEMIRNHGRVIVLEDDLVVSPHFLSFMNRGLTVYDDVEKVASIHGYCYPVGSVLPETFFIRGADCWGWATWRRAWRRFNTDGSALLQELIAKNECRNFDFNNSYPYVRMLQDQISGKNDSWAVRWYASAYLAGMLTLYPRSSLVANIGFDGTGEHCEVDSSHQDQTKFDSLEGFERIPTFENLECRKAFEQYFRSRRGSIFRRIQRRIRNLTQRCFK